MGKRSRSKKEAKQLAEPSPAPPAAPPAAPAEPATAPEHHGTHAMDPELMVPAAAGLQSPAGPPPPGAPALEHGPGAPRKAARARKPLPPIGLHLAALALLVGTAALALEALEYVYGIALMPLAAFLLGLSALMPFQPRQPVGAESAKLRLVGLTLGALGVLLVLAIVEGLAVFAATKLLFSFSQLAVLLVRIYPLVLGIFLVAAAALRIAAGLWGEVLPVGPRRRVLAGALAAAALVPGLVVLLAILPQGSGLVELTVERAPFVAALAVMAGVGAVWAGALPSFPEMGDWLGREGLRRSRLAKNLTHGFGGLGLALTAAGIPAWFLVAPQAAVGLWTGGLLLVLGAGFPSGVARFVPPMSVEDPEAALAKRKQALLGMLAGGVAGALAAVLGLVALVLDLDPLVGVAALVAAVVAQGALALVSPRVPVPAKLPEGRRSAAWTLSIAALLLSFFGLLLGSGLASGPGVGPSTGLMMLLAAALASAGHSFLRVVLVPAQRRGARPGGPEAKPGGRLERDSKEQITRTMHLTYAAGLGFTVLMVALIGATSLGVVDVEASTGLPAVGIVVLVAMLGVPVVGYFAWRFLQVRKVEVMLQQRTTTQYKKRLTPEEVMRLTILGVSISVAVVMVVFGLLTQFKVLQSLGPIDLAPKFSTDFFVFAILVGLGPYGFMRAREQARMAAMDQKFPELLRDLAESKRAGMTLTQAVITSGKGNYGALTQDIRKMAAQIEWGISFSEALQRFSKRAKTPLIERSVALIVQAQEAGGNVVDILHAAAEDAREIQLLLRERKTAMSIYVMIIYISFFVFLSVIGILDAQFLPEVAKAIGGVQGVSVGPIKFGTVDVEAFEQVFFHAAIVQAMGGGFVAGVMEEGRPSAGLRHVFIMVIVGYIAFRFLMG